MEESGITFFLGMTKQKYLKPPTSLFLMKVMMHDPCMFNRGFTIWIAAGWIWIWIDRSIDRWIDR